MHLPLVGYLLDQPSTPECRRNATSSSSGGLKPSEQGARPTDTWINTLSTTAPHEAFRISDSKDELRPPAVAVRISGVSSAANHYRTLAAKHLIPGSSHAKDFHIRLLRDPGQAAKNLFKNLASLKSCVREAGQGGVQSRWQTDVQQPWPDRVGGTELTLTHADTHFAPFSNGRKPDNSHFEVGHPAGHDTMGVVVIGELKARINHHFTPTSKGEVLDLAESFLSVQSETLGMTAYLTDGRWIQFFRVNRAPNTVQGFTYFEGPQHELGSVIGQQWFWGLMTTPVRHLGWDGPKLRIGNTPLTVVRLLGRGSTGAVYHCTYAHVENGGGEDAAAGAGAGAGAGAKTRTRDVVVKVCSSTDHAGKKQAMLRHLNALRVPGVQQFVAMTDCGRGVVTTPLGVPLSRDTPNVGTVLAGVVTTLKGMHEHSLVHRDVSRSNVLVDPKGKSLLTAVGGAVQRGAVSPYHGTIDYAAPRILEHRLAALAGNFSSDISALASDDLQSLVRVANLLMFRYEKRAAVPTTEDEQLRKVAGVELVGAHAEADAHAVREDYAALQDYFESVFNGRAVKSRKRKPVPSRE